MIAALEQDFNEADIDAKLDFQNLREDIKTKNGEELSVMRQKLDQRIDELEREFQQVLAHNLESSPKFNKIC